MLLEKLTSDVRTNIERRPTIRDMTRDSTGLGGRRDNITKELRKMFYEFGPGNGTMLSLPFDQVIEHSFGHMFNWERSGDPRAVIELANSKNFSAIALPIGLAEKYGNLIENGLPLIVKVDGHFSVGPDVEYERHSTMSSVERAIDAGASAIGFTFYFGGKETMRDTERAAQIVENAHNAGKPAVAWMYARGPLPKSMGEDSLFWTVQAVAAGEAIGADIVKQKFPEPITDPQKLASYKENLSEKGYFGSKAPGLSRLLELEPENHGNVPYELHVKRLSVIAQAAPNTLKIISGGPKYDNAAKDLEETTRMVMDSGNEGRIVGRNLWGRPMEEAMALAKTMSGIMKEDQYQRDNTTTRTTARTGRYH